jgi:hypothetical protein
MQPQKSRSRLAAQTSKVSPNPIDPQRSRTLAPGDADCCDGWMGRKSFSYRRGEAQAQGEGIEMRCGLRTATTSTLALPALQEHQLQAISAQTGKTCVCAAAVCFLVLLLPRSSSRP